MLLKSFPLNFSVFSYVLALFPLYGAINLLCFGPCMSLLFTLIGASFSFPFITYKSLVGWIIGDMSGVRGLDVCMLELPVNSDRELTDWGHWILLHHFFNSDYHLMHYINNVYVYQLHNCNKMPCIKCKINKSNAVISHKWQATQAHWAYNISCIFYISVYTVLPDVAQAATIWTGMLIPMWTCQ